MIDLWFWLTLALITLNWLSVWFGWKSLNMISKPGVMAALLAWTSANSRTDTPVIWFAAGLALSLAGDILLMLPKRFFLFGTAAFMVAHAAYIIGFNQPMPSFNFGMAVLAAVFLGLMLLVYLALRRGVRSRPAFRRMGGPLALYSLVVSLMVVSSLTTLYRLDWTPDAAGLVVSGAILFLFSDILLAADRFIRPIPPARLWKRMAYQLGQLALAAGAVIHFSR